jgi:hypothetical protein
MDTLFDEKLTNEEIDVLLLECVEEMSKLKSELGLLLIRQDSLKRKLRQWNEEKECLQLLRSGQNFNQFLTHTPYDTIKSIRKRYNSAMKRMVDMGIDV